jgi:hypothetical protein
MISEYIRLENMLISPGHNNTVSCYLRASSLEHVPSIEALMDRITSPFRQLYQETETFKAAMGNSTLPTVLDKLNVMSTIHLRKLITTLVRENSQRDAIIGKLEERIGVLESRLNEIKKSNTDVSM